MVGVMIKNLVAEETNVSYEPTLASASLKLPDGSDYLLQLILAHQIDPSQSTFKVSKVKLELKMAKAQPGTWTDLEAVPSAEAEQAVNSVADLGTGVTAKADNGDQVADVDGDKTAQVASNGTSATTSGVAHAPAVKAVSKAPKNWDKIAKEIEEQEKDEGNVDDFFKKLYEGADEDARRAMVKSFQESGGTVLSTNWKDVGEKKVEVKPPDGCEFKKWDS